MNTKELATADLETVGRLDREDELAAFRERFVIDDPALIYLDGNSLGRLPRVTATLLQDAVQRQWGERLIRGWNDGWIEAAARIGGKLARLLGAGADEVTLADSTSVNLYKLVLAALEARPERRKVVTDNLNFPSDLYVLQGICRAAGCRLEVVPSTDGIHGPVEALEQAIDGETALVALSHTVFKSAYTYDLSQITALAHRQGALVLWDLSHAAGAVTVDLGAAGADLAVGCSYKYLNGGPGAPAFLYVRRALQDELANPIQGWMGDARMFAFEQEYAAAAGLRRFLSGTPPILSLLAVEPGVDLLLEAGMERLRAKSIRQTEMLLALWERELAPLGYTLNSPRAAERRGSHVSLGHAEGWRISQALIRDCGVLPDFRAPDNIRLGVAPLYTSFAEVHAAVMFLKEVVAARLYERYDHATAAVT